MSQAGLVRRAGPACLFSMSIKHPKERRMVAFDWFIGSFSELQSSRKFDSESLMARILFGELAIKYLSKKIDTGEEFRILSFDFFFRISYLSL